MGFGVARGCSVDRTMLGARYLRHPLLLRFVGRRGRNAKCVGFSRGTRVQRLFPGSFPQEKGGEGAGLLGPPG